MKTEWLNNRQPLVAGPKAGQIGALIDFEDGTEPQRVYAADEAALNDKLLTMYGNTRNTLMQRTSKPPTPQPPSATPPAATQPPPPRKMTFEEREQAITDLNDAGKAGSAMAKLLADDSGFDIERAKREQIEADQARTAAADREYLGGEVKKFMEEHPQYYGSKDNGTLLRDRTFSRVGRRPTAEDWALSYQELEALGVLESAPVTEPPAATPGEEPLAPPPPAPRASTGVRPSSLQRGPTPVPAGSQMTRSQALDLAETDNYDDRIRREPGFAAKIERALNTPG